MDQGKWVFVDKVHCPSSKVVIADAKEVFGGSEELTRGISPPLEARKRPWEEFEEKAKYPVAQVSPECLSIRHNSFNSNTNDSANNHVLVYGRVHRGQLIELRILLDPLLDEFTE